MALKFQEVLSLKLSWDIWVLRKWTLQNEKAILDNLAKCFVAKTEFPHENQFHEATWNNHEFENSFQNFKLEREN